MTERVIPLGLPCFPLGLPCFSREVVYMIPSTGSKEGTIPVGFPAFPCPKWIASKPQPFSPSWRGLLLKARPKKSISGWVMKARDIKSGLGGMLDPVTHHL